MRDLSVFAIVWDAGGCWKMSVWKVSHVKESLYLVDLPDTLAALSRAKAAQAVSCVQEKLQRIQRIPSQPMQLTVLPLFNDPVVGMCERKWQSDRHVGEAADEVVEERRVEMKCGMGELCNGGGGIG